jgi:ATP-dependent Clp protease protease subunit
MNKIMRLLQLNARSPARKPVSVEVNNQEATVYVYGIIGDDLFDDGVTAKRFADEINSLDVEIIHLRINSPGGDVFEGRAMQQALRESKSRVVAHIDGLAASAATFLPIVADEVEISPGGFMMIHNAWGLAVGSAQDMLDYAALLEKIDGSIRQDYSAKTGKTEEDIKSMMDAETWLTAEEAVGLGFADRVFENENDPSSQVAAQWDLSIYANAPEFEQAAKPEYGVEAESGKVFDFEKLQREARLIELGA